MKVRQATFTSLAVSLYALMLTGSIAVAWWRGYLPRWLGEGAPGVEASLGLGTGLVLVALSRFSLRFDAIRSLTDDFREILRGLRLWEVALLALASGFGEEALFRGVLQLEIGLLLSAIVFAGLHIGPTRRYLWWTAFALVAGLLFGGIFEWRHSLIGPIVAHVTVNFLNLRFLSRDPQGSAPDTHRQANDSA